MRVLQQSIIAVAMLAGAGLIPASAADDKKVVLITKDEAALPAQATGELNRRGITRGPAITEVSPTPANAALTSPIRMQFKFEARGGAKIDPSGIKVTYLKTPAVDLTDRVKPFTADSGIDIGAAELPPGNHVIRVDVKDTEGRITTSLFTYNVAK
jgi:hypothetical protein